MKRQISFQMSDNGYDFFEDGKVIFTINKTDLQFDVKKFYFAFFADDNDYSEIELENLVSADKDATRIFNFTEQLIKKIVLKLTEEHNETPDGIKAAE